MHEQCQHQVEPKYLRKKGLAIGAVRGRFGKCPRGCAGVELRYLRGAGRGEGPPPRRAGAQQSRYFTGSIASLLGRPLAVITKGSSPEGSPDGTLRFTWYSPT